jgi:DNA-binding ferritin-like protein
MAHTKKSSSSGKNKKSSSKILKTDFTKNEIVKELLNVLITVKLYHWNTMSFPVHKATDDLYSELNALIDNMVEVLLGKQQSISSKEKNKILNIKNINVKTHNSHISFNKFLEEFKQFLSSLNKTFNSNKDTDLLNIRDEMLSSTNKLSYLLSLTHS